MQICLMIEGQEGVSWEQWLALARSSEDAGLNGLFRSDHYTPLLRRDCGSLDAWATLTALAAVTRRIRLGSLVSPATFRHPSVLAKTVVTADHVSGGGRVELGFGAGWHEGEHAAHGFRFADRGERLRRFAEQLEIIRRSWDDEDFDYHGEFYELHGANPLPKPLSRPNLIVGGNAKRGTVEPAVRFADEYNTIYASPDECRNRRRAVDAACERASREPLTFSLMTQCVVAADESDLTARLRRLEHTVGSAPARNATNAIVGTVDEVVDRLLAYEHAGVDRVMLQHLLHEDVEMVGLLGDVVARM